MEKIYGVAFKAYTNDQYNHVDFGVLDIERLKDLLEIEESLRAVKRDLENVLGNFSETLQSIVIDSGISLFYSTTSNNSKVMDDINEKGYSIIRVPFEEKEDAFKGEAVIFSEYENLEYGKIYFNVSCISCAGFYESDGVKTYFNINHSSIEPLKRILNEQV